MTNQTDPRCRDAFIAAMKEDETGKEYNLEWYPLLSDAKGNCDDPTSWEWADGMTEEVYKRGWCLAYQPPSDVDPESVLAKLKETRLRGGTLVHFALTEAGSISDIIDAIEGLQREVRELDDTINEHRHAVIDQAIEQAKGPNENES